MTSTDSTSFPLRSSMLAVAAVLLGIGGMLIFRAIGHAQYIGVGQYDYFLEKFVAIGTVIGSLLLGGLDSKWPWLWPLVIVESFYFAGFALLPNWGQIPPFEVIYMGLLALPGVLAALIASHVTRLFRRAA